MQSAKLGTWFMLTVIGTDRPGIVARLTDALYQGGCNFGEASMARLGGNFAIMLMVEGGTPDAIQKLVRPVAQELGLQYHVDPIEGTLHRHQEPNVQVTVHSADRPGIVAQVTGALARSDFNILDLYSDVGGTADQPIYIMIIDGYAGGGVDPVETALEPLRAKGIEVRVNPLDTLVG